MRSSECAVALAAVLVASAAGAQLDAGPEFQVNVTTSGIQAYPAVAVHPDGGFVVTWRSSDGLFLRRFDPSGAPVGTETQVNSFTPHVDRPSIAASTDGSFVVAWESGCYYGTDCSPDGSEVAIAARRFRADGSAGPELVVNEFTRTCDISIWTTRPPAETRRSRRI